MGLYMKKNNQLVALAGIGDYYGIPVGAVQGFALGTQSPDWLLCDGRDTTGTAEELRTYYPALYTYLGNSNILPTQFDHSKLSEWEDITIPTTAATAITMQYDGELFFMTGASQGTYVYIYINGVSFNFGEAPSGGGGNNISTCIPFTKGDVIYVNKSGTAKVRYYNQLLYIKATSARPEVEPDIYATKGYIRDQNLLSDIETVAITTTDTTMDYDGYLYVSVSGGPSPQSYVLYINSDIYSLQNDMIDASNYANGSYCFPFRKGDKIRASVSATSSYYAQYYKLRDYTGR